MAVWSMMGGTLAEACAADQARHEPDRRSAFSRLADRLAELGLPLGVRDYGALHDGELMVDPDELTEELIDAERMKRGLA
ncbi:hypothetical protein AB0D24_23010 [Streptomyces javensis]|uniref:hypothetical protein n=1 Tax=Streptomyces javensis TaxID=114698 RepID=UPI0033DD1557